MPDLRGLSARDALARLAAIGVSPRMRGSGFVIEQTPAAGEPIDVSPLCLLTLSRVPPAPALPLATPGTP
jgi:hypothetical protein